jgi:hypothetical protein
MRKGNVEGVENAPDLFISISGHKGQWDMENCKNFINDHFKIITSELAKTY